MTTAVLFLSTPSARRATFRRTASPADGTGFLSTPSARRATIAYRITIIGYTDFYPRPPRGGRQDDSSYTETRTTFLSTPSARRATVDYEAGAGDSDISIHALREEGDRSGEGITHDGRNISIHALREEGDPGILFFTSSRFIFLSTPSARRATASGALSVTLLRFLSTPSARRATIYCKRLNPNTCISIHALREEGDPYFSAWRLAYSVFLSTPSARRATNCDPNDFWAAIFLSTPSARRATLFSGL